MRVNASCSGKSHAFQLAEQLEKNGILNTLFTIYHNSKDLFFSKFNNRKDLEIISKNHIQTFPYLAPIYRLRSDYFEINSMFDYLVSRNLREHKEYDVFIGWSGMSLQSIRLAKQQGKKVIVERGSSHISNQYEILTTEYAMLGKVFKRDNRVEDQEKLEYELADFITVPSSFAKRSFTERGVSDQKIFVNNFGTSTFFKPSATKNEKFTILYLGGLTVQKGLIHFFKALHLLKWPKVDYEVWLIGKISDEIKQLIPMYTADNWKFFGHINHYELAPLVSKCSVMVQPSVQEGLSMVIPQVMACGVPVIATINTGGEDIISDGLNGYLIPIRSPDSISHRLSLLFEDRNLLSLMQQRCIEYASQIGTWNNYGDRYVSFLRKISQ